MKDRHIFIILLSIWLIGLACFIHPVSADAGGSTVTIETETPVPTVAPTPTETAAPYIQQGDVVYVGDTVDISGTVPPYQYLAYWDGWNMYDRCATYSIDLPPYHRAYYYFYIDPLIFGNRTGNWYKWDGVFERSGNNLAFVVLPKEMKNATLTFPNGTRINTTQVFPGNYSYTPPKPTILPEVRVSDYLLARGDALNISTTNQSLVWVFGRVEGLYGLRTDDTGNLTIPAENLTPFEPGRVFIMLQHPGKNNIFDVTYNPATDEVGELQKDPWAPSPKYSLTGVSPKATMDNITRMLADTDDTYETYKMEVQDPMVTIERFDETRIPDNMFLTAKYRLHSGLMTAFAVKGYSNMANGTNVSVVLDETDHIARDLPQYTFYTTTQRSSVGNMSQYEVYVPIIWDDMYLGLHTLTAKTPLSTETTHNFPVTELPQDSYKPNASVRYVADENPWKPNLTVNTVTVTVVETQVITNTVVIHDTPDQAAVEAAQKKAVDEQWGTMERTILEVLAGIVIVGYLLRLYLRRRAEKQRRFP